jgi:hypothetical protein
MDQRDQTNERVFRRMLPLKPDLAIVMEPEVAPDMEMLRKKKTILFAFEVIVIGK